MRRIVVVLMALAAVAFALALVAGVFESEEAGDGPHQAREAAEREAGGPPKAVSAPKRALSGEVDPDEDEDGEVDPDEEGDGEVDPEGDADEFDPEDEDGHCDRDGAELVAFHWHRFGVSPETGLVPRWTARH